jgi:protein-L-isoaspartate(D-aspartate) O-methyltransferase
MPLPSAPRGAKRPLPSHTDRLVDAARRAGVQDERVLEAVAAVRRGAFVPGDLIDDAYTDRPLPIPHGQVTTQPSLVASMIEALALEGHERILEVGTGYGWQTAMLARLAAFVWTIERLPALAEAAAKALVRQDIENVRIVVGDGTRGLAGQAPYDAIMVSAAYPRVPNPLVEQLTPGGRLLQPIGEGGAEEVVLFEKTAEGRLERRRTVIGAHFVRLYGRHGFAPDG